MGIFYNGRFFIKPAVITYVDDSAMTPAGLVGANTIGMVGPCKSGKPGQAYLMTGTRDAFDVFGEGPLVEAIAMAFAQGAQYIWAVRAGGNYDTQALEWSGGPVQGSYTGFSNFTINSVDYGEQVNSIKVGVSGTPGAGYTATIQIGENTIQSTLIKGNALNIKNSSADPFYYRVVDLTGTARNISTPPTYIVGQMVKAVIGSVTYVFKCVIGGLGSATADATLFATAESLWETAVDNKAVWMNVGQFYSNYVLTFDKQTEMPITTWTTGTKVAGAIVVGDSGGTDYLYLCTVGGAADVAEPSWGATVLGTTTDGAVTWTNIGLYSVGENMLLSTTKAMVLNQYVNMTDLKTAVITELSNGRNELGVATPITGITQTIVQAAAGGTWLDIVSDFVTSSETAGEFLTYEVKAVYDWFNSGVQNYVTAEVVSDAFNTDAKKDRSVFTGAMNNLIGGSFGEPAELNTESYTDAFTYIFEDLDLDLVVPVIDDYLIWSGQMSNADAIFNQVLSHCTIMSGINSEERIGIVGYEASTATNYQTMITKASNFNSPYITVVGPSVITYDTKGNLKTFNGTYVAAIVAGMVANYSVGEPITRKTISGISGLSKYYKNAEIIQLIDNGVCCIERVRGVGYRIVQGVTSYTADDNFNRKEMSVRLATNYIAKNIRMTLDKFIGRKNSPYTSGLIRADLISILNQLAAETVIVGTTDNPAWKNLSIRIDGDKVYVDVTCSPCLPLNYIAVGIHLEIFKATA